MQLTTPSAAQGSPSPRGKRNANQALELESLVGENVESLTSRQLPPLGSEPESRLCTSPRDWLMTWSPSSPFPASAKRWSAGQVRAKTRGSQASTASLSWHETVSINSGCYGRSVFADSCGQDMLAKACGESSAFQSFWHFKHSKRRAAGARKLSTRRFAPAQLQPWTQAAWRRCAPGD